MKSIRLIVLSAVLLMLPGMANAQTNLFTNSAPAAPRERTSIIVIQCHGLGYGDLSCYGQTNYQTPNLDRLAAEGMRFTNYFSTGTDFAAAQSAFITGKKSGANEPNIAELLKNSGYHTGLIGEWMLGKQPWKQGFDEFAGFLGADEGRNYFADYLWRFDPGHTFDEDTHQWVELENGRPHNGGREMIYPNTAGQKGKYLPELLINGMLNFVRINQPDEFNRFRPFFLVLNLPAPRSATAGTDEFPVPSDAPFSGEPWPQAAKNRAALISRIDSGIGRLFEQMQNLRLTNNVAIFFTSAVPPEKFANPNMNFLNVNGGQNLSTNQPLRLPMIVRWPENVAAGKVSGKAWSAQDFLPTAAGIGAVPFSKVEGASVLPALFGEVGTNSAAHKAETF